jgi:hypothetical protein
MSSTEPMQNRITPVEDNFRFTVWAFFGAFGGFIAFFVSFLYT